MNRDEFIEHLSNNQEKDLEILKNKNQDYANGDDPFQNFSMVEDAGFLSVEEGIAVRMSDKMQRIFNLLNRDAAVEDESLMDTLSDLRNYANILQVYLEHEAGKNGPGYDVKMQPVFEGVKQRTVTLNEGDVFEPFDIDEEFIVKLQEVKKE